MTSEAQKRANRKYRQRIMAEGKLKRILLEFYPSEGELYEWAKANKPTATYLKRLIKEDMDAHRI